MKLDWIATFVAVAEARSISAAARRLHLSKSVVSARLAELEKNLGATLVHRTTRKLTLTEDGTAFLERAGRIVGEIEDAAADFAARRGALSGPPRLSAPVTFGRMHLGPALYSFLVQNQDVELTLELDDRRVDAAADGFDAVIRHGPISDSRLVIWRLAPSRRVLVASPAYLDRYGMPRSFDELAEHRGIFYTNRGLADWHFAGPQGAVGVRARTGLRVNNGDMMRDAAMADLGIALLPTFIVAAAIAAGTLKPIHLGAPAVEEFVFIAYPEGRQPSLKLRRLVEHLKAAFGNPPYWDRSIR